MEAPIFKGLFTRSEMFVQVKILPADVTFEASNRKTLLESALDLGLAYPHKCRSGFCKTCMARLVSGKVMELTQKSYVLTDEELAANCILVCQSIPKTNVVLKTPRFVAKDPNGGAANKSDSPSRNRP